MIKLLSLSPLLLAFALQAPPKVEPGFTSLFNGKDFTGWKLSNEPSWSIEDGAIKANGTPGTRSTTARSAITCSATSS